MKNRQLTGRKMEDDDKEKNITETEERGREKIDEEKEKEEGEEKIDRTANARIKEIKGRERERAGSLPDIEKWLKRKRKEESELSAFKRSNIVRRSPTKQEAEKVDLVGLELEENKETRPAGEQERNRMMEKLEGILNELESVKREMERKEKKWEKEKREMITRIEELEKKAKGGIIKEKEERVIKLEKRLGELESRKNEEIQKKEEEELSRKVKWMEWKIEKEEREKRKRNIVIKGVKKTESIEREIEEICRSIEVKVEIEGIKELRTGREERGEMILVKLKDEEMKREVMRNKGKLKGKEIWIEEDLIFRERRIKRNLRRIAEEERREGKKIRQGYGKIWIEDRWWFWDEERETLVDGEGKRRLSKTGEEGEGLNGK